MYLIKVILLSAVLALSLSVSGCQGNNTETGGGSLPSVTPPISTPDGNVTSDITVVLPNSASVLTTNNEIVTIQVKAFDSANNPYSSGKIVKINPDSVLTGRDIGSFDKFESTLTNGVATFTYTAPKDLKKDKSSIVFGFYHDSNASKVIQYTMSIVPEVNQTILTNYSLQVSNPTDVKVGLNSSKLLSFGVYDANNNQIDNSSLKSITMTSLNPSLGTFEDTSGNSGTTITIKDKNNVTINIITNTKSGVVPIKVDAVFTDVNNKEQNLTKIFDVIILSGPPTAMSLSYAGTDSQIKKNIAKMVERWVLTVTDKYNNLVNTNPSISMGMLAGYAKSSVAVNNSANYLYYLPSRGNGTLNALDDTFTIPMEAFENVNEDNRRGNEYLVTFGDGYTYNASGKWDINKDSNTTFTLIDNYEGDDTSNLGFAVGNNFRQNACAEAEESVGNIYPDANNYILDATGNMILNVEYDYYLTGKDVVLWVNLVGAQNSIDKIVRIGEAKKVSLRGTGLESETYSFSAGFSGTVRLHIFIKDTVEYLKNANFGYAVEVASDGASWSVTDTSMNHGITYCYGAQNQNGESYVDVTFSSPTPNAGTVTLTNVLPANEF